MVHPSGDLWGHMPDLWKVTLWNENAILGCCCRGYTRLWPRRSRSAGAFSCSSLRVLAEHPRTSSQAGSSADLDR